MKNLIRLFVLVAVTLIISGCGGRGTLDRGSHIDRTEIMFEHNKYRAIANSDKMLKLDPVLEQKAQAWAEHMAERENMVHSHLTISGDFIMLGENIAMGYEDIDAVMSGWMNSTGHRHNILNPQYTHAGFGYARFGDGTPYWCAQFGTIEEE